MAIFNSYVSLPEGMGYGAMGCAPEKKVPLAQWDALQGK
jgi:hypothetical protein